VLERGPVQKLHHHESAALFFPWVLDVLFPLWDAKNQTLHDKVAGTVVITT